MMDNAADLINQSSCSNRTVFAVVISVLSSDLLSADGMGSCLQGKQSRC